MSSERTRNLSSTVKVIVSLVRTVQLRNTLHLVSPEPSLNFWRVIYGNLTDMVVLEWCKLFGSDDEQNQPVHWKNIASDPDRFRKELLEGLGIYESKWRSYWTEMKRYRDMSVAHHDARGIELLKNYPTFDLALESAYFYYDFVVSELLKQGINQQPKDLRAYCKNFAVQSRDIATAAIDATKSFKERVH
jgi:hypothetical protein